VKLSTIVLKDGSVVQGGALALKAIEHSTNPRVELPDLTKETWRRAYALHDFIMDCDPKTMDDDELVELLRSKLDSWAESSEQEAIANRHSVRKAYSRLIQLGVNGIHEAYLNAQTQYEKALCDIAFHEELHSDG